MENYSKHNDNSIDSLHNDEINLNYILRFFLRNKKIISSLSFIFFVLAFIFSLSLKKIWQGQFQIVLNSEEKINGLNFDNSAISNLVSSFDSGSNNNLKTEVGILKSPSLLMPIYDFVVSSKQLNQSNKKLFFYSWEKDLDIELEKGTSILNITYRDPDKKLIIPVLRKISIAYQEYSGKSKKRQEEITRNYLLNQISIFKENSSNSLKASQDFAIDQDLIYFNSDSLNQEKLDNVSPNPIIPNIAIENVRVNAANKIRIIDQQLKKIKDIESDSQKLLYIGSTILPPEEEGLPGLLEDIEEELVEKRLRYTENDPSIIRLLEKRQLYINLLKKRTIGILKARRIDYEAAMEAAMRPKGVLLRHKELMREAARDESTLIALENQLMIIDLEIAKENDPWELITNPTLLKTPVGPQKKLIALYGLLIGFTSGSLLSFYKERKSNIIYENDILKDLLSTKIIDEFKVNEITDNSEKILFLREYLSSKFENKTNFIFLGDKKDKFIKNLKDVFNFKNCNNEFIYSFQEFKKLSNTNNNILIFQNLSVKFNEINIIKKYIDIFNIELSGIILIDR